MKIVACRARRPALNVLASGRTVIAILGLFFVYAYFHQIHYNNAMAASRLDLLHSVVNQGTLNIDCYHTNTPDKAVFDGHYYCDKAPGTAFLALPAFYGASKILSMAGVSLDSPKGWFLSSWMCVAGSVALITAIGMVCLFGWLRHFVDGKIALLATSVIAFGSLVFPHATMLLSHAEVVGLFGICFYFTRLGCSPSDKALVVRAPHVSWHDLVGGAACGFSIACEYDAALVAGGVLIMVGLDNLRRGLTFVLGAIPPLLLIPAYNWACVGNPFSLPYAHEAVFTAMHSGFYGIHLPNPERILEMLLSPRNGLLLWSPFFCLAPLGYNALYRRNRSLFWLCYVVPALQLIVISGYYDKVAGCLLGERYLAPMLPLLILPAAIGAAIVPRIATLLALFSVIAIGGATIVSAKIPVGFENPILEYYLPQLRAGHLTHNLGELLGLHGYWTLAPLGFLMILIASVFWLVNVKAKAYDRTES